MTKRKFTLNDKNKKVGRSFTIIYRKEAEGYHGYSGRCLELPAAISQGETLEELVENMLEAIELVLSEELVINMLEAIEELDLEEEH